MESACSTISTFPAALATVEFWCPCCKEQTTIGDSLPVNREKPFGERRCRSCSNYIRALQKGNVWDSFKKKLEEQRTAAYKDRKGKKFQALDVGDMEVSVEENDTRYKNQHAADKYLPFAKWRAQRILEDFSKQAWSDDKWMEEWTKILDDPDTDKIYQRGQWHIGE